MMAGSTLIAAPVRIDFSGNTPPTLPPTGPGFRISDQMATDTPNVAESFDLGSRLPNNAGQLNYLRITSATSSTGGSDVSDFIVVIPGFLISDNVPGGAGMGAPFDMFGLSFKTPTGGAPSVSNGFAIYAATDLALLTPLLLADIALMDPFIVVSESALVEGTPGAIGLSNIHTLNGGAALATLQEFAANGTVGADFTARINSAGDNIGDNILNQLTSEGSANGSMETVPEPATLALVIAGAVMFARRRTQS